MDRRFFYVVSLFVSLCVAGIAAADPLTYFTNEDPVAMENALVSYIDNATTSVYCAIYGFDLVAVEQALIDAYIRLYNDPLNTDPVRIVTDLDTYNDNSAPGIFHPHFVNLEQAGQPALPGITVIKDDKSSLMHNKFCVIDGHIVWTGSTNITDDGFYSNKNNAVVFDSAQLAGYYTTEFDLMWGSGLFGVSKIASSVNSMTYNGYPLEFYFSPKDAALDAVINEVNNASQSIYFNIYFFTSKDLRDALIARHNLGVTVVGIWDALGELNYYSVDEDLCNAGIPIKIETYTGLMHNKFMVIDWNDVDPRVITGSMNWTNSGDTANDENTVIIHDPLIAAEYKSQFDAMYNELDPSTLCVVGTPAGALNLEVEKVAPSSIRFTFDYIADTTAIHIYGVQSQAAMDAGDYLVKIEDLEHNSYGTWVVDDPINPTIVEWTLIDGSLIPDGKYVVVGENNEGEGPYGNKSNGTPRSQDLDKTAPICIGCSVKPQIGDLVINEILADPAGDANGDGAVDIYDDEFVEIVNLSDDRLNLQGLTFSDLGSTRHVFPSGSYLEPCQAVVLFGGGMPTGSFGGSLVQTSSTGGLSLNNAGDTLTVRDGTDIIDQAIYGGEAGLDVSIVRWPEATLNAPFVLSDTVGAMLDFTPGYMSDGVTSCFYSSCQVCSASIDSVVPGTSVCIDEQVDFNGSGTGEGTLTYQWDFDYDGISFDVMASGSSVSTTFTSVGNFTVALRVTDSCGTPGPQLAFDTELMTVSSCTSGCPDITINEIDSDTPGTDTLEFVEMHNNTGGTVNLATDGYVLVFFNGDAVNDASYRSMNLTGSISDQGYYLVGNSGVSPTPTVIFPNTTLQNGFDAVALYKGTGCSSSVIPNGTTPAQTIGACSLVDAIVYHSNDADDPVLRAALGQSEAINESANGSVATDSIQRVTDSQGCPMGWVTPNWKVAPPTAGSANAACPPISATISSVTPAATVCLGIQQTFSGSGSGQTPLTYEWDFDYDGLNFDIEATGETVNYTYLSLGVFTAALRVTDSCASPGPQTDIDTVLITINDCCFPISATISPIIPSHGVCLATQQTFNASGTGEGALTYQWDFDYDGVTFDIMASGASANYTYASTGYYTAAVMVTDSCGDPGPQSIIETVPIIIYSCSGACADVTINEIDSDTPSTDVLEFIELHNNTGASVDLTTDKYVIVLYNGDGDISYDAVELIGTIADLDYFVLGNSAVVPAPHQVLSNGALQNGTDAIALYRGENCSAAEFPDGTPAALTVGPCALVDAIVYETNDADDPDLWAALGQTEQIDEAANGTPDTDSIQRVTDSQGCPMGWVTPNWKVSPPTPGGPNSECPIVSAIINSVTPDITVCQGIQQTFNGGGSGSPPLTYEWDFDYDGLNFDVEATGVSVNYTYLGLGVFTAALRVTDSCTNPGPQTAIETVIITINDCCYPVSATIFPITPSHGVCLTTQQTFTGTGAGEGALTYQWDFDYDGVTFDIMASGASANYTYGSAGYYTAALRVTDSCGDPGPQSIIETVPIIIYSCSGACSDVTINEIDSDTPSTDVLEFIELHNNTGSSVDLTAENYVVVLFNGDGDISYRAIELAGTVADLDYFVLGNSAVVPAPDQILANSALQNGTDAIALYRGLNCSAAEFPDGTPAALTVGPCALVDAIVYETNDADDPDLWAALGQTEQIDESANGTPDTDSIQRVVDSQGCPMGWVTPNWKVAPPTPGGSNSDCPIVSATIDSVTPDVTVCLGLQQTFAGSGSGKLPLTFEWDFDYDGLNFDVNATGVSVNYTYPSFGVFTAALRITDSCTNPGPQIDIDTVIITINDCCLPISAAIDPIVPSHAVCLSTQQTFTGTGAGEGALTYQWDFDYDGVTFDIMASGATTNYSYGVPGYYTAALRVIDSCGVPGPQSVIETVPVIIYSCSGACPDVTINEIDSDTPSTDVLEFIELHNNTGALIDLTADNYIIVMFNGDGDISYDAVELLGTIADLDYFVLGNSAVVPAPDQIMGNGTLQNGPDAIALYRGLNCSVAEFPDGTPAALTVGPCALVDAIVYETNDADDLELMAALGQTEQIDESANGTPDTDSIQRVTDSQGCPMGWITPNWKVSPPTPGGANSACPIVSAIINSVTPDITVCQGIQQTFNGGGSGSPPLTYEWDFDYDGLNFDVEATGTSVNYTYLGLGVFTAALRVTDSCASPGPQTAIDTVIITINDCCYPVSATIFPITPSHGVCLATQQTFTGTGAGEGALTYQWDFDYDGVTFDIMASGASANYTYGSTGYYTAALRVTDSCGDPGPQSVIETVPIIIYSCAGACPDVTINEIDSDTPSTDVLEFIELHNNTGSSVDLTAENYVVVLFNGDGDISYRAIELAGTVADLDYFVLGNSAVVPAPDQILANGAMQNGADAVALYRGQNCLATEFPNGTPAALTVGPCALVDAIVYDTNDADDLELMAALGQTEQIDESANGTPETDSIQRVTDSQGCPMGWVTPNYMVSFPTPGLSNSSCAPVSATILDVLPSTTVCLGQQQDFSSSGSGAGTLTFEWDFDYDGLNFTVDASGQNVSFTYLSTGLFTAAVRVTDSCSDPGPQEAIDTIGITVNYCCAAISASVDSVLPFYSVCLNIQQTLTGSGTGDGILTYAWDFDYDGLTFDVNATGQSVNVTYATTGSYTAALRVTDSCGDPGPQQAIRTVPIIISSCGGPCPDLTINEVDADQTSTDVQEFIELHNNTDATIDLASDGYVLVFYDGSDNASYPDDATYPDAIDLNGTIAVNDFYLIGNSALTPDQIFPDNTLQNGADAVALYRGLNCSASQFPNNTTAAQVVGDCVLVDAVCYDTSDPDAATLMAALGITEQINEDENGLSTYESVQRISDSQGCPMGFISPNWKVSGPTPGYSNTLCTVPIAQIVSVTPSTTVCIGTRQTFNGFGYGVTPLVYEWDFDYDGLNFTVDATGLSVDHIYSSLGPFTAALRVTDACGDPGPQSIITSVQVQIDDCCALITASIDDISPAATVCLGTLQTFTGSGTGAGALTYEWDLSYDGVTFNVEDTGLIVDYQYSAAGMYDVALRVTDSCTDPGPQVTMDIKAIVVNSCSGGCPDITINEIDTDQVDPDTLEFVEFHNNTGSFINLAGRNYVLVFFNGSNDSSYFAIDLTGTMLNGAFYTVGNSAVVPTPNQLFDNSLLQDGADAVALYRGLNCSAQDFNNTPAAITYATCTLVDAIVYGNALYPDNGLLNALGQIEQIDEAYGLDPDGHSIQRTTNSQGCPMHWEAPNWKVAPPTPRASN